MDARAYTDHGRERSDASADKASLRSLLDAASSPYRQAGRFAYHFARGKLGADPVYRAILQLGLMHGRKHILDLGCGQGLLSAWLQAAAHCCERGLWPQTWPPATRPQSTRGIELMARDVARARLALGSGCEIVHGDIRSTPFGSADAVVILDVLHYMDGPSQRDVLERVRAALPPGGVLLLRVGDAAGGLRFRITQCADKIIMSSRGHGWIVTHCRSVRQWCELLGECGFEHHATPMSHGTPFANVLLVAHAR